MKNRMAILALVVAVVAVSCGGGESADQPTTAPATEPITSVPTTNAAPNTTVVEGAGGEDTGATDQSPDPDPESDSGLPDDLVAPGAVFAGESSSGIKFFTSPVSFDETVSYYEGVLSDGPVNVGGTAGYRVASFLAETPVDVLVQIEEGDGELLIYITLTG